MVLQLAYLFRYIYANTLENRSQVNLLRNFTFIDLYILNLLTPILFSENTMKHKIITDDVIV